MSTWQKVAAEFGYNASMVHHASVRGMAEEIVRLREVLGKIADPRKRDHQEPDKYTELGCVMNMANEAITKRDTPELNRFLSQLDEASNTLVENLTKGIP